MRVVILGNGAAGNQAADTIRKYDPAVEIVMISEESFPAYSACALPDCMAGWISRSRLFLKQIKDYEEKDIKIKFGQRVKQIQPVEKRLLLDKETIEYDKLILATGSRALIPALPGTDLPGNQVLKSVADVDRILEHLPRQVVVIGSGNIGVEAAEALELQGCEVTLLELQDRLMPRFFDNEPAALLRELLEAHGIKILTGQKVIGVSGSDRVAGVVTEQNHISCDMVVWAVGVRQNVELAKDAGIEIGSLGGIKVNRQMESSIKDIWACGDCIESYDMLSGEPALSLLWPSAKGQAEVAALNIVGRNTEYEGSFNVVVEEIYDRSFISAGSLSEFIKQEGMEVWERYYRNAYYRLIILKQVIVGLQAVGNCSGTGAIINLIKNRTPLSEIKRVFDNPFLLQRNPGYWEAGRILFSRENALEVI